MSIPSIVLALLGTLTIFIFGMNMLSEGLQLAAGDKMKKILATITGNPLLAVLTGAVVTGVLQSSGVTTVMVIGFVSAGLLTLPQAIGVILGANIGTTVTAQLIAFDVDFLAYVFLIIGFVMTFFMKKHSLKYIGQAFFGFGLLFIGLNMMGDTMKPLVQTPFVENAILSLADHPVLGAIVGMLSTAILQSSSATTGVLQKLASQPIDAMGTALISLTSALPIIFGFNIGSTATAQLATIGGKATSKRAAWAHTIFNVSGTLLFFFFIPQFAKLVVAISPKGPEVEVISRQIANAHTLFNIICTVLWIPFIPFLAKLVTKLVKSDPEEENENKVMYINPRMLDNAPTAIELTVKELTRMGTLAQKMITTSRKAVIDSDKDAIKKILDLEVTMDMLKHEVVSYISSMLSVGELTEKQSTWLASLIHITNDFERIGDHCNNMAEYAETRIKDSLPFSEEAISDLGFCFNKLDMMIENSIHALATLDKERALLVTVEEDEMDDLKAVVRERHIDRLNMGLCNPQSVIIFIEIVDNMERIGDHCNNVAEAVLKES